MMRMMADTVIDKTNMVADNKLRKKLPEACLFLMVQTVQISQYLQNLFVWLSIH